MPAVHGAGKENRRKKRTGKNLAVWSKPDGIRVCLGEDIWLPRIFSTLVI